jgi:hypothetical protein
MLATIYTYVIAVNNIQPITNQKDIYGDFVRYLGPTLHSESGPKKLGANFKHFFGLLFGPKLLINAELYFHFSTNRNAWFGLNIGPDS